MRKGLLNKRKQDLMTWKNLSQSVLHREHRGKTQRNTGEIARCRERKKLTSQGMSKFAGSPQKVGKGQKRFFSRGFKGRMSLPTLRF